MVLGSSHLGVLRRAGMGAEGGGHRALGWGSYGSFPIVSIV